MQTRRDQSGLHHRPRRPRRRRRPRQRRPGLRGATAQSRVAPPGHTQCRMHAARPPSALASLSPCPRPASASPAPWHRSAHTHNLSPLPRRVETSPSPPLSRLLRRRRRYPQLPPLLQPPPPCRVPCPVCPLCSSRLDFCVASALPTTCSIHTFPFTRYSVQPHPVTSFTRRLRRSVLLCFLTPSRGCAHVLRASDARRANLRLFYSASHRSAPFQFLSLCIYWSTHVNYRTKLVMVIGFGCQRFCLHAPHKLQYIMRFPTR